MNKKKRKRLKGKILKTRKNKTNPPTLIKVTNEERSPTPCFFLKYVLQNAKGV